MLILPKIPSDDDLFDQDNFSVFIAIRFILSQNKTSILVSETICSTKPRPSLMPFNYIPPTFERHPVRQRQIKRNIFTFNPIENDCQAYNGL
jgi:hypothetical protein